jgi:hypothetical protein
MTLVDRFQRYVLPFPPPLTVVATARVFPSGLNATDSGMYPVTARIAGSGRAGLDGADLIDAPL